MAELLRTNRRLGCRWWPLFSESASSLRRPKTASQLRIQTTLCVVRVAYCFQKNGKPGEHQRAASPLPLRSRSRRATSAGRACCCVPNGAVIVWIARTTAAWPPNH